MLNWAKTVSLRGVGCTSDQLIEWFNEGKYQDILNNIDGLISKRNNLAVLYNLKGACLSKVLRHSEAIQNYQTAIIHDPDFPDAHNNLGNEFEFEGKCSLAVEHYKNAIRVRPRFAQAHYNLGVLHHKSGQISDAKLCYETACAFDPNYAESFNNLGNLFKENEETIEAIDAYQKALNANPDHPNAKFLLAALLGESLVSCPRQYVERLFDQYASRFEKSAIIDLYYELPQWLPKTLHAKNNYKSFGSVLEIGCGTGLFGEGLKVNCTSLIGVDISHKMMTVAAEKNVYDELHHEDCTDYLRSAPLNFDYIAAFDVFPYIGGLENIFELIKTRTLCSGKLVFTTEHNQEGDLELQKTGRFSHSKEYIENLCDQFKYKISYFGLINLRKENRRYLCGGLYVLEF